MFVLLAGALDMALIMRPVLSESLNEIPLVMDEVKVGVVPSHPLAERRFVTCADLKDTPIITFDNTFNMRAQLTQRMEKEKIAPLILPGPIIDYFAEGSLTLIPFHPSFPWELRLIFRKNAYMSVAGKALIGHIQKSMMS